MKRLIYLILFACALVSCHHSAQDEHKKGDIEILRADQLFFGTPEDQLGQALAMARPQYRCAVFDIPIDDPAFGEMVGEYTQNPYMRELYDTVQAHYPNLVWLERELTTAVRKMEKAYGEELCTQAIAYLNGTFDYQQRTYAQEGSLLISLDQYVLPCMEKYGYCQQPLYIVNLSDSAYLLSDCLLAIAQQVVPINDMRQMLDYMVAEGKALYMLDIACPKMEERLKMRYTPEQMEWMQAQEKNVWAYLVQHKMLFESDFSKYHNFIDEAPKTNSFGQESAPRAALYIGWQIVRQYAKKTGCTLPELLNETNSNTILTQSGYRP